MIAADRAIAAIHARWPPVDQRVEALLASVRAQCEKLSQDPSYNRANERLVEDFIRDLQAEFGNRCHVAYRPPRSEDWTAWTAARARRDAPCVVIERQRLSAWALRTTRWNFIFTVPGDSEAAILLVAHYDTWRGPGADDNTTGEEMLKQYLLADLRAERRPPLTHVYFLAGSEECGLIGLLSQLLLAVGLQAANLALSQAQWGLALVALGAVPLAGYRFGVSGSREYVRTLSHGELARLRAVISVDSVGEGRLYIPRGTLGADFLRVLIPFGDYDSLNDLLEEAAHLHGIKYNNYLAGGTTDHVSFLEVNNGLLHRAREALGRAVAKLEGRPYTPPLRVPASALVCMVPGKASPIVFGGKIHTPRDVPERVYPEPLRDTLLIVDYVFHRLEGGGRPAEPRELGAFHYARLYRSNGTYLLALKDAIEPNRRNVNAVYTAEVELDGRHATATVGQLVEWGVESSLRRQVQEYCAQRHRPWERVKVDTLEVVSGEARRRFERRLTRRMWALKWYHRGVAAAQHAIRRWFFLTFFGMAWVLAQLFGWLFDTAFELWPAFAIWFGAYGTPLMVGIVILELAFLLYMMARRVPTWIDNGYRHENRADNLGSLRRVPDAMTSPRGAGADAPGASRLRRA